MMIFRMMNSLLFLILSFCFFFFLCWGSLLNVIGHRIVSTPMNLCKRSRCPVCLKTIRWYDLIPFFSWIFLQQQCRFCNSPISWLYPFIEVASGLIFLALLLMVSPLYIPAYFIFFSALIVTIRSDIEYMLISRYATTGLIPIGMFASLYGFLPISFIDSFLGACVGYFFLYIVALLFKKITGMHGLGQGDLDLLAFIGSFCGIIGCWATILVGSIAGSLWGIIYLTINHQTEPFKLPFGPFLAMGAIAFVLFQPFFVILLIG